MTKPQNLFVLLSALLLMVTCKPAGDVRSENEYFNNENRTDVLAGGVRMIDIKTASGLFKVWTKRVGNNPAIKVLLLHGGPGATHEYLECFDSFLRAANIEYYYYDQLGSYYSDQPEDTSLWNLPRFVEEVEQVRQALGLTADNFYLYGHSWGGILALEYALKYQQNLKGLIISNMVSSIPDYITYAEEVLGPQLDPQVLTEIRIYEANKDYNNPRYMELIASHYYPEHILRLPLEQWPDPVNRGFDHINPEIYVLMQGPSEFGVAGDAKLKNWERKTELPLIQVPTLTIGGNYDTMDPEHMAWMAGQVQQGRYLGCPQGSHMAMYDDQQVYMAGLIKFINDVNTGSFGQ